MRKWLYKFAVDIFCFVTFCILIEVKSSPGNH